MRMNPKRRPEIKQNNQMKPIFHLTCFDMWHRICGHRNVRNRVDNVQIHRNDRMRRYIWFLKNALYRFNDRCHLVVISSNLRTHIGRQQWDWLHRKYYKIPHGRCTNQTYQNFSDPTHSHTDTPFAPMKKMRTSMMKMPFNFPVDLLDERTNEQKKISIEKLLRPNQSFRVEKLPAILHANISCKYKPLASNT